MIEVILGLSLALALGLVWVLNRKNLELTDKLIALALSKNVTEYKEAEKVSSLVEQVEPEPEFISTDQLSDDQFESLVVQGNPLQDIING